MTPSFFPRETHVFHALELSAWRTLSLSAIEMGALTGVLLRGLRAVALTHAGGVGTTAAALALGAIVLFGMLTLHLANFPVRRWPRHVAAFTAVEVAAEVATSALLVLLRREPLGTTGRAAWSDLPSMALSTFWWRLVPLAGFALVLAGVVQVVRRLLPRHVPHPPPSAS